MGGWGFMGVASALDALEKIFRKLKTVDWLKKPEYFTDFVVCAVLSWIVKEELSFLAIITASNDIKSRIAHCVIEITLYTLYNVKYINLVSEISCSLCNFMLSKLALQLAKTFNTFS